MKKKNISGIFCVVLFLCSSQRVSALEADPFSLEPIVVSKQKASLLKSYRLDEEQLQSFMYDAPLRVIRFFSVDTQARSPHADIQSDFSMRGSSFQGVLMLLDGARINDPQTAHHNSDIPFTKEDIARIEVLPGAASSLYGPDAMGGAIQIRVKKPIADERFVELSGGEFNTSKELLSVTERIDPFGVRLSVENQQSDGFSEDTDFKKFTSALSSMWSLPDGEFDLNFGYQEKEFGAYDFYTPGLKYPSKEWTKTYLLNSSLLIEKDWVIRPAFLWRRHYDKFMLDKTEIRSKYLNHHRTDMFTPGIYFSKDTDLFGEVGFGAEYGNERIRSTNLGKHTRNHKAIAFDDSILITRSLRAGASARIDNYDRFDAVYTGSSSLRYYLSDEQSVHAGINRSMRVPSFTELYYNDPTTVGDENLSAEKAVTYQAGYEDKRKEWLWGCVFYFRNEHEVIDWVKQSPSQAKWKVENITEADVSGIETYYQVEIRKAVSVKAYYDYTNKRINDRGLLYKYGPNYARHKMSVFVKGNFPYLTPSIGATYKKSPRRGGWVLWDSRLAGKVNKHTQVYFLVSNMFDKEYQDIEGIPSPGRWFEAGIRLEW